VRRLANDPPQSRDFAAAESGQRELPGDRVTVTLDVIEHFLQVGGG
jgi:hypothetical protein